MHGRSNGFNGTTFSPNKLPSNGKKVERQASSASNDNHDMDLNHLTVKRSTLNDPTEHAEWSKKKLIWMPHEKEGFVAASIRDEAGGMVTVQVVETGQTLKLSKDDCQLMNPPKFDKVINLFEI
jgi:myosin protein heavy chain